MLYVAVDIGCLECGEETHVLGVFTSKEKAEEVCKEHEVRQAKQWHGEHIFEVFLVGGINDEIRIEYK